MRFLKFIITGFILSLALVQTTNAITSYDVHAEPQMYLDVSISSSTTSPIRLAAPVWNGETVNFNTTSGGILRIRSGSKSEEIYYSSASINSTTKVVTLSGVIRNICRQYGREFRTCGNGQQFNRGSIVELAITAQTLNLKANIDRSNVLTASGALSFSGSGSFAAPTFTTTSARDQQLGANPAGPTRMACVTGTGVCYYYLGGQWISFGSGAQVNASITLSGRVQAATADKLRALTDTGSTGALNVLTPSLAAKNGSGATSAGKLVLTNSNGVCEVSLGCTGRRTHLTGALIVGQGAGGTTAIGPGSANQVLVSDGSRWAPGSTPQDVDVLTGSIASSNTLTNPNTAVVYFTQTGSLTTTQINTKGKMFQVLAAFQNVGWNTGGSFTVSLKAGSQVIGSCSVTPTADGQSMTVVFYGTIRTAGASGVVEISSMGAMGSGTNDKACSTRTNTTSFDTTTNKTLNIGVQFGSSNAGNNATLSQFASWSLTP